MVIREKWVPKPSYTTRGGITLRTPQLVAVYGTLKRGGRLHKSYIQTAPFIGEATIPGVMLHCTGCPAILLGRYDSRVFVEIFRVSGEELDQLDRLEGVPDLYDRMQIDIPAFGKCWIYTFDDDQALSTPWRVLDGVWRGDATAMAPWDVTEESMTYKVITDKVAGIRRLVDAVTGDLINEWPIMNTGNREVLPIVPYASCPLPPPPPPKPQVLMGPGLEEIRA